MTGFGSSGLGNEAGSRCEVTNATTPTTSQPSPAHKHPHPATPPADWWRWWRITGLYDRNWYPNGKVSNHSAENAETAIAVPGEAINNLQPAAPYSRRVPPTSRKDVLAVPLTPHQLGLALTAIALIAVELVIRAVLAFKGYSTGTT